MARQLEVEDATLEAVLSETPITDLKPLARFFQNPPPARKPEMIELLANAMLDPTKLRAIYAGLDKISQAAIQEAVAADDRTLDLERFQAKYDSLPYFGAKKKSQAPSLKLFFPGREAILPSDLRSVLKLFVPRPIDLTVAATDELPAKVLPPHVDLGPHHGTYEPKEVEPTVRATARAALHDVIAVLRLIDVDSLRVSDKTHRPSAAAMKTVAGVLLDGEYYQDSDDSDDEPIADCDLTIKAFAWPMLVQAAGLAKAAGSKLQLTAAGRTAATRPAHEVIREIWKQWLKTKLVDEYNRIEAVKGQTGMGREGFTPAASRREVIVEVLRACPVHQWLSTEEMFRLLKASRRRLQVTDEPWDLYICDKQYGSLGYEAHYTWEVLEGRYTLAFLFEYAATLGLIDVAYLPPDGARNDYCDRWGTDDLDCLSRYDGLTHLRINALGAWCLGLRDTYQPEAIPVDGVLKVLPNLDVVAARPPLSPADVLFLDRFAGRISDAVWHLSPVKVLEAVEDGLGVAELREFLTAKSQEGLPQTVVVFLDDVEQKASLLEDLGTARLIACKDTVVAQTIVNDRRLRGLCRIAGDNQVVFKAADEAAVRRGLRELGYVVPRPR